jgi:hypothetical protein
MINTFCATWHNFKQHLFLNTQHSKVHDLLVVGSVTEIASARLEFVVQSLVEDPAVQAAVGTH